MPTLDSFVAWKTAAWLDRAAPRDLYDLFALAGIGAITPAAAQLFAEYGPIGAPPRDWMFTKAPSEPQWVSELATQTRLTITAAEALQGVRHAWRSATN